MGKKENENLKLLKEATDRLIKFVQNNPNYYKSYGMGKSLRDYVDQLERDLKKKKRRYKTYLPGTIVYVHFGMNFGEEFSKTHYAIILSNNDNKNKRTVTVIPLTSKPGDDKMKLDFNFSRELFHLTYQVAMEASKKSEENLISEINSRLPCDIEPYTSLKDLTYLFDNQEEYSDLLDKVVEERKKSIKLLESASKQMDRFQRTTEKMTYAALDCVTTIDKNKIESRISEIDVLSATVLGDVQLKKLSKAIAKRIIFDT